MGTKKEKTVTTPATETQVELNEESIVDSSLVSTEESLSELEAGEGESSSQSSVEASDGQESSDAADSNETIAEVEEKESIVETLYLDDSRVGVRFDNFPLSPAVIQALAEDGHVYPSRYQQSILNVLTLGVDKWFSVNLASNRGLIFGTYLVDIAQTDLTKTTAVLCVAVPKIRKYFERDLLSIARYTGVSILSVHDALPEKIELTTTPNIIIASIDALCVLQNTVDFSNVEIICFDEVEKTLRDNEEGFVDFVLEHNFPQVVLQSSYYSEQLIESVHRCKPDLHPTRLFKHHKQNPNVYALQGDEPLLTLQNLMPSLVLNRVVLLVESSIHEYMGWFQTHGWDAIDVTSHETIDAKDVDDLRENRTQILLVTKDQFLASSSIEFDTLLIECSIDEEYVEQTLRKHKKISDIYLLNGNAYLETNVFGEVEVEHIVQVSSNRRKDTVTNILRQNVLSDIKTDWNALVGDILEEPDGHQLLGEALRLAMRLKRAEQGYIRSSVYRLESKDVFQKRHRRKSR